MNTQTSALFGRAIDKIRDEMADNAKDGAIEVVGEFLTALLGMHPERAELILEEKKSIKGAVEAMKAEAAKHKNGSWACLDFFAGIRCVIKYYGMPDMENCQIMAVMNRAAGAEAETKKEPEQVQANTAAGFDLDALLDELEG